MNQRRKREHKTKSKERETCPSRTKTPDSREVASLSAFDPASDIQAKTETPCLQDLNGRPRSLAAGRDPFRACSGLANVPERLSFDDCERIGNR